MITIRFGVLALLLVGALSARAQSFGEKVEVRLIEIDAVVTDSEGDRVHGLTAEDFELFEGRRRQEISNFAEYRSVPPRDSAGDRIGTVLKAERGTVLVLVDWLPRTEFVRERSFEQLGELLSGLVANGHRAALVFWDPTKQRLVPVLEPTDDADVLRAAMANLNHDANVPHRENEVAEELEMMDTFFAQIASGLGQSMEGHNESARNFQMESEIAKFRRKTRAMRTLVQSTASERGRSAVLYVSHLFSIADSGPERVAKLSLVDELTRAANAAGVTFYASHPSVPEKGADMAMTAKLHALEQLAAPTGGLVDFGAPSLRLVGAQIVEDLESYYTLAYRAESDGRDRERRVSVRARNRTYTVRVRESIVEQSDETIAREKLIASLYGGGPAGSLTFGIARGEPRRSGRNRWRVPVQLQIPTGQLEFAREGSRDVARVKVFIASANGLSEVTGITEDELRIVSGEHDRQGFIVYSVELAAEERGSVVAFGVFDQRSGLFGAASVDNRALMSGQ